MPNKNAVFSKYGRYVNGGDTEVTQNKIEWWERTKFPTDITDNDYVLESIYEGRPDNLADVIYGDDRLYWIILQYNNILDIEEEFVEGKKLILPTKERVFSDFLNNRNGGFPSTRIKE